jgi:NAD(P)H-flavin reductase
VVDADRLKASFGKVAENGDEVPLYFYSYLFLRYPEVRAMFPPSMAAQRDRLVGALVRIVTSVDRTEELVPFLQQLGRDHRKFRVLSDHYPAVGDALLATLAHFLRDDWTPDLAAEWTAAYGLVADVMSAAATEDEKAEVPGWWEAEVVAHELRLPDLAVLTVRPHAPLPFEAGQSLSLELAARPRLWRFYSPANAPRADGTLEFHVRAVDGGWVSSALVYACGVGDTVNLGPPVGELALDLTSGRDVLMLAGGTGLAPLRAMVEQFARQPSPPQVHLFLESRTPDEFYDLPAVTRLRDQYPWLHVTQVSLRGGPGAGDLVIGPVAEVALHERDWAGHDVYVCGSMSMVERSLVALAAAGVDGSLVRHETFGYRDASGIAMGGVVPATPAPPADAAGPPETGPQDGPDQPARSPEAAPTGAFLSRGESA